MQNKALTMATYVAKTFGWKVFPVNPSNKKPLISGWQRKATNQIKDLERLFSKHPSSMLGLPTGPINGISVIDFDIRKDVNGIDSFFEKKLSLPISSCAHTPSGGYHIYLRTDDLELPNHASTVLGRGVDFRGKGGYVVCPPSVSTRGQYSWGKDWPDPRNGIKNISSELVNILKPKRKFFKIKKTKFSSSFHNLLDPIYEGQRDMELTRRCGVLFKKLSSNEVLNQLNFINVRCCRPPLKERQVYKIFNSIRKREGV